MGAHGNKFNDGRGPGAAPDIGVFNGTYFDAGASGAFGIGYGYGSATFAGNSGGAVGILTGPAAGIGLGLGDNGGSSKVVSSKEYDCNTDCEWSDVDQTESCKGSAAVASSRSFLLPLG